ncbi:hypothetical protein [Pseudanabaena sp. FACHB-2040]|uniref:hypothetical protein n=1 Tax=Pseudanabaena sp. FACHB-2040 TaxID=2692859 RepID=UPI0016896018|nr:hypothetical protein [Pseudanabaena sp. FACHB-2040]MBD2261397.1 hypothetical protein [Pseudanabaena sp. FACHB-2040]
MPDEQPMKDCDWSKVTLPRPSKAQSRPSIGELSDLDWAKLMVVSKLIHKSIASVLQTAVITYLNRNWHNHLERLHIVANRENISIEEAFEKIVKEELEP